MQPGQEITQRLQSGDAVLVTVDSVQGSVPREPGAAMLVTAEGFEGREETSTQAVFGIHVHLAFFAGLTSWALNRQYHRYVIALREGENFRVGIKMRNVGASVVCNPSRLHLPVPCGKEA